MLWNRRAEVPGCRRNAEDTLLRKVNREFWKKRNPTREEDILKTVKQ